ncbi:MAG: 3-deoxy-manno-octulosonate cytidylyltransferase [Pseudomonadota bacterium]
MIPARRASQRLPDKPLADIGGVPMIVRVWRCAQAYAAHRKDMPSPLVACDDQAVATLIAQAGGQALLTDPDLPSGSDRVFQALERFDPKRRIKTIINLQGDMPFIEPSVIDETLRPLQDPSVDLATVVTPLEMAAAEMPQVVKVAAELTGKTGRALYFSRARIPYGGGRLFHHIGVYAWRRASLARFIAAPPSQTEQAEQLEQLRALALGMKIGIQVTDTPPLSVDVPADLERARALVC